MDIHYCMTWKYIFTDLRFYDTGGTLSPLGLKDRMYLARIAENEQEHIIIVNLEQIYIKSCRDCRLPVQLWQEVKTTEQPEEWY